MPIIPPGGHNPRRRRPEERFYSGPIPRVTPRDVPSPGTSPADVAGMEDPTYWITDPRRPSSEFKMPYRWAPERGEWAYTGLSTNRPEIPGRDPVTGRPRPPRFPLNVEPVTRRIATERLPGTLGPDDKGRTGLFTKFVRTSEGQTQGGRAMVNTDTFNRLIAEIISGRTSAEISPEQRLALLDPENLSQRELNLAYRVFERLTPEAKLEVGGYVSGTEVISGEGREVFEYAIHHRMERTGAEILKIDRRIQAHQARLDELGRTITPETPSYVRAEINKTWNRINALLQNSKALRTEFFSAQYNLYRLRGDEEFDPTLGSLISQAAPTHPLFTDPSRAATIQREIDARRDEGATDTDIRAYIQSEINTALENMPGIGDRAEVAARMAAEWEAGRKPTEMWEDFAPTPRIDALSQALENLNKARLEAIEAQAQHATNMAKAQRNILDIRAAGAFPIEGPGAPMRITSGQYMGQNVVFLGVENPNTRITPGGWHVPADYMESVANITDTARMQGGRGVKQGRNISQSDPFPDKGFVPDIGLRYRPGNMARDDLLSKIQARVIPDTGGEIPILKAFETTAVSSELTKAARQAQRDWLWRRQQDVGADADRADALLQEAISVVDRKYSEAISNRVAAGANKMREAGQLPYGPLLPRASRMTLTRENQMALASVMDPVLGRQYWKAANNPLLKQEKNMASLSLADRERVAAAREELNILQGKLRKVSFTTEEVAREMMAGLLYTEGSRVPYSQAYMAMFRQPDQFTTQLRGIIESVIPEVRGERLHKRREGEPTMVEKFQSMLKQHAGDLGVDAPESRRGAILNRMSIIRGQRAQVGRDIEIPTSELMREEVDTGERVARILEKTEARWADVVDMDRPEDVINAIDERAAQRAEDIRRYVQYIADAHVEVRYNELALQSGNLSAELRAQINQDLLRARSELARRRQVIYRHTDRDFTRDIQTLYSNAYNTLVEARARVRVADRLGISMSALNEAIYRRVTRGIGTESRRWIEDQERQREYIHFLGEVRAGRVPNVTEKQFFARHLERLQAADTQRYLTSVRRLPREIQTLLERVPPGAQGAALREQGIFRLPTLTEEASQAVVNIMADIHNWDPTKRNIFQHILRGTPEDASPFYGGTPGAVYEHLSSLYARNVQLAMEIPGFQENYRKLYSSGSRVPLSKIPKELTVRIANVQQIALDAMQQANADNIAITFDVLGAHESDEAQAMTMAALHYERYVESLRKEAPRLGATSVTGRSRILEMAANELKGGGPISFTQQMTYRQMGLTPNLAIHSRDEAMRIIEEINTLSTKKHGSPIYTAQDLQDLHQLEDEELKEYARSDWAIYLERGRDDRDAIIRELFPAPQLRGPTPDDMAKYEALVEQYEEKITKMHQYFETADIRQIGGYEFTPNTDALSVVERLRSIRFRSDEAVRVGTRNTVTQERNIRNQAAAKMAVIWRRTTATLKADRAKEHGRLLTDIGVKPVHPITGAHIDDIWDSIIPDIDKELEQYGLNWEIVRSISESFNGVRAGGKNVNAIGLGSWVDMPDEFRARQRALLSMREKGSAYGPIENYFYSPLAAGRFLNQPKGHPKTRMYDAFAELLWRKNMSDEELESFAESTLGKDRATGLLRRGCRGRRRCRSSNAQSEDS
jgi:hypothetical protein